jgi:hypothetical protein
MSTCSNDNLLLLAAGEASPELAESVRRHAAECPACAEALRLLRDGLEAVGRLPPLEPSGLAVERTIAAAGPALRRRRARAMPLLRRFRPYLAAAAVVGIALGISALLREPSVSPGQLDRMWQQPSLELAESGEMVDDLLELHEASPWTAAETVLATRANASDVDAELLRLEETLDQLETLSWDS